MNKKILTTAILSAALIIPAVAGQHLVQKGETMSGIAKGNDLHLSKLVKLNPQVKDINLIYPNQKLNLGDGTSEKTDGKAEAVAATGTTAAATTTAVANDKSATTETKSEKKLDENKNVSSNAAKKCSDNMCDNVINGNPMYRPNAGHFYSVTSLETNTEFKSYGLNEEFGYGITNWLSILIDTTASTADQFKSDSFVWNYFGGGLSARFLDAGNWKGDAYGKIRTITLGDDWWHKDQNAYMWTAGTKLGYSSCEFTLNGLFEYDYANSEAFNWDIVGHRQYRAGIEGQYVFNADWNVTARAVYEMPEFIDNYFTGKLGLNYNINKDMYVGVYAAQSMDEKQGKLADETTLGLQFGIDF